MRAFIERNVAILNKYNIIMPAYDIVYFDNALGGARTKNNILDIVFLFSKKSYKICWNVKNIPEVLFLIDAELGGDVEKNIHIIYDNIRYDVFSEALVYAILSSKTCEATFVGSEKAVWGASIWIRYVDTEWGIKQLYLECRTNYV